MKLNHLVKAGVAIFATAATLGASAATSNGITVSISPAKKAHGKGDDVWINVTMTNTSGKDQLVAKWHTPFAEELEEGLFEITRDGEKVPYLGAHYKRGTPTSADYFVLKAGKSYHGKVELSGVYDMSITGDYVINYKTGSMNLFQDASEKGELKSDKASFSVDGVYPRGYKAAAGGTINPAATGPLNFSKCTTSQQSTITQAMAAAQTMANGSYNYTQAGTAGQRYTKWFGAYTASRYSTVKAHFAAIKDAFDTKPVTVDCGCKKTYYAYVYPTQPYTIYVCKAFWTAPLTGTDSKGGTLVHEMSHFNAVAGTDDHAYGQSAAAALATSNPDQAVDNADSHEYFSENTPALN